MPDTPPISAISWVMILLLALIWGGTFMVTEIALTEVPPFWVAATRVTLAALVMMTIWSARGFTLFATRPSKSTIVSLVFISAASSAVPFSLLAWGQQYVTSGFAGVSMAATALITLPLAHFFVASEKMSLRKTIGFAVGFAGVVVLIGAQAFEATGNALETPGRIACLAAASCYSISSILMRRLPAIDPIGLASILLVIASFITLPLAFTLDGMPPIPSAKGMAVLAFLGLVPTAAANFLRVLVVRSAGPVFMSLVNYQVPLWSVLLGALVLAEPLPSSLLSAMILILTGVGISQYRAILRLFT